MKTLDQWCKTNHPQRRKSKLEDFHAEITELYSRGYQIEQIQLFLKSQNIEVSVRYIRKYIKNKRTSKILQTEQKGAHPIQEPTTRSSVTQSFIDKYK